jgi:MFS family permease
MVLVIGVAMGIALGLPTTFVRTYAGTLGIAKIGLFFGVYAPAALATRLITRRLPERFGTRPMILAGAAAVVLSQFLFLPVREAWHLVIPGLSYGVGHGLMFPSVVGEGIRAFPRRHRGLAMLLVQGTWDMGQLIGAPAAGLIVEYSFLAGMPAYPTLFMSVAAMMTCVAVLYGRSCPREVPQPEATPARQEEHLPQAADVKLRKLWLSSRNTCDLRR